MIVHLLSQSLLFRASLILSAMATVLLATPYFPVQLGGLMTLLMCAMFLAFRPTPFEAILPVDARTVLLARICVGLVLTGVPLLAWIVAGLVRGAPEIPPSAASLHVPEDIKLAALGIAALLVVVPHAQRPGVLSAPGHGGPSFLTWELLVAASGFAAMRLLPGMGAAVVLTGAAMAMLAYTLHRMPRSYLFAPSGGDHERSASADVGNRETDGAAAWWRPLPGIAFSRSVLFMMPVIALGGVTGQWLFFMSISMLPEAMGTARPKLQWVHALPLPRMAATWVMLAPSVAALLVAGLAAVVIPTIAPYWNRMDVNRPHAYTRDHEFDRRTMVPLAFWRVAPDGETQVVQAPWGESTSTDIIALPGVTLYNPFSAEVDSSPELIEWQFSRAAAAVHGRSFTMEEYHAEGFAAPRRVTNSLPVYLLGGAAVLTYVLLMAWLAELARWHALATRPLLRYGIVALLGAGIGGVAVAELYGLFRHSTHLLSPLGAALAMSIASALPNTVAVAVVAAAPVAAAYALLRWQVSRSDVA